MLPARRPPAGSRRFETTRWTLVRAAAAPQTTDGAQALAAICSAYWYPLYGYVRQFGHGPDDAADLTQQFFLRLIERNDLEAVRRERGRFRSYLLAALKHFLLNEASKDRRLKRGGAATLVTIDSAIAESNFSREPADPRTPETAFQRRWALAALGAALTELEADWTRKGRADAFRLLKPTLLAPPSDYAILAANLGMTTNAAQVAVHRIRRELRTAMKRVVGETVLSPGAIDAELAELLAALDAL